MQMCFDICYVNLGECIFIISYIFTEPDRFVPNENGGLPITTIVVPVFCIVVVAGVVAGVLFYRKRKG